LEVSDSLLCLYNGRLEKRGDSYVIEVPEREVRQGDVRRGDVYRVALLSRPNDDADDSGSSNTGSRSDHPEPPVDLGDIREVTIESTGNQGDGIAKVDRGYVVIVPGAREGDEVTVKITKINDNFAIGEVIKEDTSR
jgi:predicted RNA-binding protein with TRAM domain